MHERMGHYHIPGVKVNCPACAIGKDYNKTSHKQHRPVHLIPKHFLEQVDWDFKGPITPVSFNGRKYILSAVDSHTGWVENYPVASKDECHTVLERFIREVGMMDRLRTDNDPVFKGDNCEWQKV